jgi:3-hydroxyisobutyrate dehydrogenase
MSTVGFIGLGAMGGPMARNLLRAGHSLTFCSRRPEVVREFEALGGRHVATPAEAARASEFILTIVTADAEVSEIALGKNGIIEAAAPDKLFVDMSTIGPQTVRQIAARLQAAGMGMLDAPVSGGPGGAAAATLAIMAGGEQADFERCRPIFQALGKHLFHVGPLGAGQTIKLVNQLIGGGIMALVGEGFALAAAAGADLKTMTEVIKKSSGNSTLFEARAEKFVLADNYSPGFTVELMRKDLALALDLAQALQVPLPVSAAAFQLYTAAMHQGRSGDDFAAVAKVCELAAGVKIADGPRR